MSPDRDLKLETHKLGIIYGIYKSSDYRMRFGLMNDAKWQDTIDVFTDEALPRKLSPKEMYTNQFVDSLDEAKQLAQTLQGASK